MRGETTEWEAIIKAWNVYIHERLGVFTLPNVSPDVSDYFRAGFAAGVAHARQSVDSATFNCNICGQQATIGTRKPDGSWEIRCPEHFPEVPGER